MEQSKIVDTLETYQYPALSKFMAATHHGYNVLKMPGCNDIITVAM